MQPKFTVQRSTIQIQRARAVSLHRKFKRHFVAAAEYCDRHSSAAHAILRQVSKEIALSHAIAFTVEADNQVILQEPGLFSSPVLASALWYVIGTQCEVSVSQI